LEDEPVTIYREDNMAEVDKSAGFFPRFILDDSPEIEPDKTPIRGDLLEISCSLARLLGELSEQGDRDQLEWAFSAMQHLKEQAEIYFSEIHGENLDE
jgi:hypothetical protein